MATTRIFSERSSPKTNTTMDVDDGAPPSDNMLAKLSKLLTFRNPIVQQLLDLNLNQCHDKRTQEWTEAAVSYLVKKLSKRKDSIKELLNALSKPDQPSNCITIPRTVDGRIQVSNVKEKSHLIFCRIFRWPHIQSHHELTALDTCKFSFKEKLKEVCINPYHYKLSKASFLPSVYVPSHFGIHSEQAFQNPANTPAQCSNNIATTSQPSRSPASFDSTPSSSCGSTHNSASTSSSGENVKQLHGTSHINSWSQIRYEEVPNWGRVAYYEMNHRVGEIFICNTNTVTIDGFTYPHNNTGRFCLGKLSNVNRSSATEQVRQNIGKGLQLVYAGGLVFAENKSNEDIFIQSRNCNICHALSLNTVCKIPPSCSLCIFNNNHFGQLLSQSITQGFENVYELTKMCTIRISFTTGWGAGQVHQDIITTPCWIELHLEGPFSWLDRVLSKIGSPKYSISSVS